MFYFRSMLLKRNYTDVCLRSFTETKIVFDQLVASWHQRTMWKWIEHFYFDKSSALLPFCGLLLPRNYSMSKWVEEFHSDIFNCCFCSSCCGARRGCWFRTTLQWRITCGRWRTHWWATCLTTSSGAASKNTLVRHFLSCYCDATNRSAMSTHCQSFQISISDHVPSGRRVYIIPSTRCGGKLPKMWVLHQQAYTIFQSMI